MSVFSGLIQEVEGNLIPRGVAPTTLGGVIQAAGGAALAAVMPDQFESFNITIQLIAGSDRGPDLVTDSFTFAVMPESLIEAQRYLMNVTPTLGGVFVDDFGRAPSPIMLSGTFGRQPRVFLGSVGNVTSASGIFSALATSGVATGYGMCKRLSAIVEASHTPSSADQKLPRVYFYNWAFNSHWEVAINAVDFRMDVQQNNLWVYSLQLTTLRPLSEFGNTNAVVTTILNGLSGSLITDTTSHITSAVQSVANTVSSAITSIL